MVSPVVAVLIDTNGRSHSATAGRAVVRAINSTSNSSILLFIAFLPFIALFSGNLTQIHCEGGEESSSAPTRRRSQRKGSGGCVQGSKCRTETCDSKIPSDHQTRRQLIFRFILIPGKFHERCITHTIGEHLADKDHTLSTFRTSTSMYVLRSTTYLNIFYTTQNAILGCGTSTIHETVSYGYETDTTSSCGCAKLMKHGRS